MLCPEDASLSDWHYGLTLPGEIIGFLQMPAVEVMPGMEPVSRSHLLLQSMTIDLQVQH